MTIHHSTIKRAEKAGVTLVEENGGVTAFWPKRALRLHDASAQAVLQQMQAAQVIIDTMQHYVRPINGSRLANVVNEAGEELAGGPHTPFEAHQILIGRGAKWKAPSDDNGTSGQPDDTGDAGGVSDSSGGDDSVRAAEQVVARATNGVALDGRIAYKEGTPAGDNPFPTDGTDEDYANAQAWDEAWDNAADEVEASKPEHTGTVVKPYYRAKYAEMGNADHCGDWMANVLNNLVAGKKATDIARFEAVCDANGVSLAKYDRTRNGWQGRLRMTGRNMLAKRVYRAGGLLLTPIEGADPYYLAPADWMEDQRAKQPKEERDNPIPQPVIPGTAE